MEEGRVATLPCHGHPVMSWPREEQFSREQLDADNLTSVWLLASRAEPEVRKR